MLNSLSMPFVDLFDVIEYQVHFAAQQVHRSRYVFVVYFLHVAAKEIRYTL